jgi:hypothetical protein
MEVAVPLCRHSVYFPWESYIIQLTSGFYRHGTALIQPSQRPAPLTQVGRVVDRCRNIWVMVELLPFLYAGQHGIEDLSVKLQMLMLVLILG